MCINFEDSTFWTRGNKNYCSKATKFITSVKNTMVIDFLDGEKQTTKGGSHLPQYVLGIEDIEDEAGEIRKGIEKYLTTVQT